ncbi:MAG: hypothetical protein R2682_02210 [Pyrinomonadaceae bacterium]
MTENDSQEFQSPPPREDRRPETAQMSEIGTVTNIFIEPGKVLRI